MPRIWLAVSLAPQSQPHGIRRPSGRPRFGFRAPQSLIRLPTACSPMRRASAHMVRDRGLFGQIVKVGSHLVLVRQARNPSARHLRTTRAPDEMEPA